MNLHVKKLKDFACNIQVVKATADNHRYFKICAGADGYVIYERFKSDDVDQLDRSNSCIKERFPALPAELKQLYDKFDDGSKISKADALIDDMETLYKSNYA